MSARLDFIKQNIYAICISFFAAMGTLAALAASLEKFHLLKDPNATLNCSVNSVLNCGTVLRSEYAELFGIPLSFGGLVVMSFMFGLGFLLVQKPKIPAYLGYFYGAVAAFLFFFAIYLAYIASYQIGAICPWCQLSISSSMVVAFAFFTHAIKHNIYNLSAETHQRLISYIKRGYFALGVIIWFALLIAVEVYPFISSGF